MKIRCIAIDDEPLALKQIGAYIQNTPFLELVAECQSAFECMEVLRDNTVQLMFIDISMPDLSGMEFVQSMTDKPYVVFITAYSEYALEGFQVDAVDYLLKPISYTSFLKAAYKVKNLIDLTRGFKAESIKTTNSHLFVKSEYKLLRIELDDIKYIESMHEYIRIHLLSDKPVMTLLSMKAIEEQLPADKFMRIHRSYIVSLDKIKVIERNRIVFDWNVYLPVSDQYKDKFQEFIDRNFI